MSEACRLLSFSFLVSLSLVRWHQMGKTKIGEQLHWRNFNPPLQLHPETSNGWVSIFTPKKQQILLLFFVRILRK